MKIKTILLLAAGAWVAVAVVRAYQASQNALSGFTFGEAFAATIKNPFTSLD